MDQQKRRAIKEVVNQACTRNLKSNSVEIDANYLKQIKKLCRESDDNVDCAFEQLWALLKHKKSSQVRFYALLITNELFKRSKKFRSLLSDLFQEFIAYVVTGDEETAKEMKKWKRNKSIRAVTDLDPIPSRRSSRNAAASSSRSNVDVNQQQQMIVYELPPPNRFATLLRDTALQCIEEWEEEFGDHYKTIKIGYQYLKKVKNIRMPNLREQRQRAQREREEREEHTRTINLLKYERVKKEYEENIIGIGICLKQIDICIKLIVPDFNDLFGVSTPNQEESEQEVVSSSIAERSSGTVENDDDDEWESTNLDQPMESMNPSDLQDVLIPKLDNINDGEGLFDPESVNPDNESLIDDGYTDLNDFLAVTGLGYSNYEIQVSSSFDSLKNADNESAFGILKEGLLELQKKWFPMIKEWLSVLTKVQLPEDTSTTEKQKFEQMLRFVITLKEQSKESIKKCEDLEVYSHDKKRKRVDEDSNDSQDSSKRSKQS